MSITISSERAPKAFTSHHAMVTTTTKAMTTTNVDDEAHGRKYGIFLSRYNGDHDSKNQRRQTTTVGRQLSDDEALCLSTQYIFTSPCATSMMTMAIRLLDDSLGGSSPWPFLYEWT